MRTSRLVLAWAGAAAVACSARGKVITDFNDIEKLKSMMTVTFTEYRSDNRRSLTDLGQPYRTVGLVLPDQVIDSMANLAGFSGGAAIRSAFVSPVDHANVQTLNFTFAQRAVGFSVKDALATKISVTALDREGKVLDTAELAGGDKPQYVGFVREHPEIVQVRISAAHASLADAQMSPMWIDDISFAVPLAVETNSLVGSAAGKKEEGSYELLSAGVAASMDSELGNSGGLASAIAPPSSGHPRAAPLSERFQPPSVSLLPEPTAVALGGALMLPALLRRRRRVPAAVLEKPVV
jgi:hypothetical protein